MTASPDPQAELRKRAADLIRDFNADPAIRNLASPDPLRDQIATAISEMDCTCGFMDEYEGVTSCSTCAAAAVMAVVQPALDAKDAERVRWTGIAAEYAEQLDAANRALAAVRELHPSDEEDLCENCSDWESSNLLARLPWPCPTFLAASPNPEQGRTEQL